MNIGTMRLRFEEHCRLLAPLWSSLLLASSGLLVMLEQSGRLTASEHVPADFLALTEAMCLDCHTVPDSEARLDLSALIAAPLESNFQDWRRVIRVLQSGS